MDDDDNVGIDAAKLRSIIRALGFADLYTFADWLGINERTARRWSQDNPPAPLGVGMLLAIMRKYGVDPAHARQIVAHMRSKDRVR